MARSEQQIQDQLLSTYLKNLDYFKKNDPDLFKKIDMLSNAINNNLYEERYALEYVKEIDDFDILELSSNRYLYNRDIKNINKQYLSNISLSKNNIFSNLNAHLYKEYQKSYELPNKKYTLLDSYLQEDMSELNSLFKDIKNSDKYKYVDKMFSLGTLLGTHIQTAIKKVSPKFCFIYEPNLEIFRLSLFTTDYEKISSSTRVLYSVMDFENVFLEKLELFLSQLSQFSNYNIKYIKLDNIDDSVIHTIITKLHLSNPNIFDYTKVLYDTVYSFSKNINGNRILTLKELSSTNEVFDRLPILFVGAGPSLSNNMDWLRENQNKFIIVAMGATYKKLFDYGIRVDIVTTVEQQYEELKKSHFKDEDIELLKDTIVIASICTPHKIVEKFNKDKLFLFETYQAFKENSKAYNGASVGEVTLSILLDMNIKNIYLLGIDLAIDEKTGSTHFEGYRNQKEALVDKSKVNSIFTDGVTVLKDEYLEVKGNTKEKVITTRVFSLSIAKYTELISQFKKEGQSIYNLSKDAAFIQGVEYFEKEKINQQNINIDILDNIIIKDLNFLSEEGLSTQEEVKLNNRIENIDLLISLIDKTFTLHASKNIYNFNEKLEQVFKAILDTEDYTCSNMLANYLNFALPFIYLSLNDEKITNKIVSKKINIVEDVLKRHLIKILEGYNYFLAKILKEDNV